MLRVVEYREICSLELSNHQSCTLGVVNSLLAYKALVVTRSLNEVVGQCYFRIFFFKYILMVDVKKPHFLSLVGLKTSGCLYCSNMLFRVFQRAVQFKLIPLERLKYPLKLPPALSICPRAVLKMLRIFPGKLKFFTFIPV